MTGDKKHLVLKHEQKPKGPNVRRADEAQASRTRNGFVTANKARNVIVAQEPHNLRSKAVGWTTVKRRG
jgi:hypothetical protein